MATVNKFRIENGLSVYAFACGYLQVVHLVDGTRDIKIELYADGCWHIRAYDFADRGRLAWISEDNLSDARDQWARLVAEHIGADIKAIKKDKRYTVTREYSGEGDPAWVARFCGEERIGAPDGGATSFGCSTREQAWARCFSHNWKRLNP